MPLPTESIGRISETEEALERKTEQLALSLAMMKATLDSATDAFLLTDERFRITAHNERFLQMWQVSAATMERGDHQELLQVLAGHFGEPEAFKERVHEICRDRSPSTFDVLKLTDGRVIERHTRPQVLDGRLLGRAWCYRDVTEQLRSAEAAQQSASEREQLLQSERAARVLAERMSALRDDFLGTLSHELRTPLSAIMGWVYILRRSNRPEDMRKGLETIERSARAQVELINDLLDMNRIAAGKVQLDMQPLEPLALLDGALASIRPAAQEKHIEIVHALDPEVGAITADPGRIQQVLGNLLANAVKFTPEHGRIEVRLTRLVDAVEIGVLDTGVGIDPDFAPHVFERFRQADSSTTRQYGGLGLGLSIVKSLVDLHGGTVRAESAGKGQGAAFFVRLPAPRVPSPVPRDAAGPPPAPEGEADSVPRLQGLRVLVVDDDESSRYLVQRVLGEYGVQTLMAATAAEALRIAAAERLDLVVSDIRMPEVDGFELLRRLDAVLAQRGGAVPAIALTAFARPQDREQSLQAGFATHLSKPIDVPELIRAVAQLARRKGRAPR